MEAQRTLYSACPHDCPSTCALEVEKLDDYHIGRVRGAVDNDYTAGVVCSKVARYAERVHHPDRLLQPLRRTGAKGGDEFAPLSWDAALDEVAEQLLLAEQRHGSEAVWPYFYAGTMGLVMRDGINRLRHAKRYSGQHSHHLHTARMEWLYRRYGQACRRRSARDGARRCRDHLGHQCGKHPSQRDDACAAGPARARRQDCLHRYVRKRDREASRFVFAGASGHRWRVSMRCHAHFVS